MLGAIHSPDYHHVHIIHTGLEMFGDSHQQGPGKNLEVGLMASSQSDLRSEVMMSVVTLSDDELLIVRQTLRLNSIRRELEGADLFSLLPGDAVASIGSYLDASTVLALGESSKSCRDALDLLWKDAGKLCFCNMRVNGESFECEEHVPSWHDRYLNFRQAMSIRPRRGVVATSAPRKVTTCIPEYRKATCTLPAMFSVSTAGGTFMELTVSVRFSPEGVRSVIGLIESPITISDSLLCDRGLSRQHWGLAFGPLTGVVSSEGRYFDDFSTYRARHGLHDYLARALEQTVTLRVGILIDDHMIAFYRLPEQDYVDWECTGFVYRVPHDSVVPCLMFSSIGHGDDISVRFDRISNHPPYYPHTNEKALRPSSWSSFAEEGLDLLVPPPNTPVFSSATAHLVEGGDL